jgi:UDP-N-acetylglucosamine--dolichyl-phosphate N-acetylglucosaminephosphotransferase
VQRPHSLSLTLATLAQRSALPAAAAAPSHAALGCASAALLLGFVDDVLDVPWRVKLALPALAAAPMLMSYTGSTGVVVPLPLRAALGGAAFVELGVIYKLYMLALAVFCTNSINILAGINGLEAGQTLVIALACAAHNLAQMGGGGVGEPAAAAHALSLSLVAPLAAVSAGLLCFNWYPASVFVGDTFTLFAGMALAVAVRASFHAPFLRAPTQIHTHARALTWREWSCVTACVCAQGILGHFSETLLLFFAPQVFNFVYSLPQLARIVPCPRHRLPRLDPATGLLHATPNYNLVNLALQLGGPRTERSLCALLLALQVAAAGGAFALRAALAGVYK